MTYIVYDLALKLILLHVHPSLGNELVNTFPQKQTRGAIGRLLLSNETVNMHP
jgi:hypothetical protein